MKHPAYFAHAGNAWIITPIFLPAAGIALGPSQLLVPIAFTLLYRLRSLTEERHMSEDPAYVAYIGWIARHGLVRSEQPIFEKQPSGAPAPCCAAQAGRRRSRGAPAPRLRNCLDHAGHQLRRFDMFALCPWPGIDQPVVRGITAFSASRRRQPGSGSSSICIAGSTNWKVAGSRGPPRTTLGARVTDARSVLTSSQQRFRSAARILRRPWLRAALQRPAARTGRAR